MTEICIKYNPYQVLTDVTINGQKPKQNSSLNITRGTRLQEWVERLPKIVLDECRDANVAINFVGTVADYEDLQTAMNEGGDGLNVSFKFEQKPDVSDAEKCIDKIFDDIQKGPVDQLRNPEIINAFNKAKNQRFEINVVATMSSGKSTLINALLGQQLMPAANEATTATIVRIIDTDSDHFSAKSYDKSGNVLQEIENVSFEDMKRMNGDKVVSTIELSGRIPFVSSVGMRLVLVDTPGPNNSRDKQHEEMTYKMLSDSDKSLVLYVMNGDQLGINDEKIFLDYICSVMKNGGKQARERFIFAVNKMDAFRPKEGGAERIVPALEGVKTGLEGRGIFNPNIFPVSAIAALEKRVGDEDDLEEFDRFKRYTIRNDVYHFEKYYDFTHLPLIARHIIEDTYDKADEDGRVEIHSGIFSIEQAIRLYINKYARTTKVYDLVQSFNSKLDELSTRAKMEDAIRKDQSAKAAIEKQIAIIKSNIESARKAQTCSKSIDSIDLTTPVQNEVRSYLTGTKNTINKMMTGRDNKVKKDIAKRQCEQLEKETKSILIQLKIQVEQIIQKAYKNSINSIVEEYKKYLSDLNIGINTNQLGFNSFNLVSTELANLSTIIAQNTEKKNEGYYKKEKYQKFVKGDKKESIIGGAITGASAGAVGGSFVPGLGTLFGGIVGAIGGAISGVFSGDSDHYITDTRDVWVDKYVDYVDMTEVASSYLTPLLAALNKTEKMTVEFVEKETIRLKDYLKKELAKIDQVLDEKLDTLSKTQADANAKAEEIKKKQEDLKWLESIQERVNQMIKY